MAHQKSGSIASKQAGLSDPAYEAIQDGNIKAEQASNPRGVMEGWPLDIAAASAMLILPMLVVTAVLLALIFMHRMPSEGSTYSYSNLTNLPLGSALYVDYSPTTLVYIASLSSTLSTILISAAMILFSYSLARNMARNSDSNEGTQLPSPFQLQLLIRVVDGRLGALLSYFLYIFNGKHRKVPTVPILWQAVSMMLGLVLLA